MPVIIHLPEEVKSDIYKFKEYINTASPETVDHILKYETNLPTDFKDLVSFELLNRGMRFEQNAAANNDTRYTTTMDDMLYKEQSEEEVVSQQVYKDRQFEAQMLTGMTDAKLDETRKIIDENPIEIKVKDMGWGINARYDKIRVLAESDGDSIVFNLRESEELFRQNYLNELKKRGLLDANINIKEEYLLPNDQEIENFSDDINYDISSGSMDRPVSGNMACNIDDDDYEDF